MSVAAKEVGNCIADYISAFKVCKLGSDVTADSDIGKAYKKLYLAVGYGVEISFLTGNQGVLYKASVIGEYVLSCPALCIQRAVGLQ